MDALIDQARHELDRNTRKQLYAELQRTLADEPPYINLWYFDNVLAHSKRVRNLTLNPSGNYDFLKTAELDGIVSRRLSVASVQSAVADDQGPTTDDFQCYHQNTPPIMNILFSATFLAGPGATS